MKLIYDHISSFHVKQSHYSGKEFNYLSNDLTVKKMYECFLTKYPTSNIKYEYYNKYFRDNFNLSFGRPQVDTCCKCEDLSNKIKNKSLNETAKRTAVAEMIVHKRQAKQFYTILKSSRDECKIRNDLLCITFDYMQNLQLPKIPVQDLFYLRQLTINLFGIRNMKSEDSMFFLYHEGEAYKGPNEVCTFLLTYFQQCVPSEVKELRLFSDNCPGQNKNNTVVRFCQALVDTGRFEVVEHYFPIRGHSFLDCDRDFGLIKRTLRKIDRIYTLREYLKLIIQSSNKNKFKVQLITHSDIFDFKSWWNKYYKKTCNSVESSKRSVPRDKKVCLNVSFFHHYIYKRGMVTTSEIIKSTNKHTFWLTLPGTNQIELPTENYKDILPINSNKMKDIKKSASYIAPSKINNSFWNEVLNWQTIEK